MTEIKKPLTWFQKFKTKIGLMKADKCYCIAGSDGKWYCSKVVQGHFIACKGPYDDEQTCTDESGSSCE